MAKPATHEEANVGIGRPEGVQARRTCRRGPLTSVRTGVGRALDEPRIRRLFGPGLPRDEVKAALRLGDGHPVAEPTAGGPNQDRITDPRRRPTLTARPEPLHPNAGAGGFDRPHEHHVSRWTIIVFVFSSSVAVESWMSTERRTVLSTRVSWSSTATQPWPIVSFGDTLRYSPRRCRSRGVGTSLAAVRRSSDAIFGRDAEPVCLH
jgi:hypothetical protein